MLANQWGIKFSPRQIVTLKRCDGVEVDVRVESLDVLKPGVIHYHVRDIKTAIAYLADGRELKPRKQG